MFIRLVYAARPSLQAVQRCESFLVLLSFETLEASVYETPNTIVPFVLTFTINNYNVKYIVETAIRSSYLARFTCSK